MGSARASYRSQTGWQMKNLKRYLLATACSVTVAGSAVTVAGSAGAADLAIKGPTTYAVPYMDTWTGFYVGGFVGVGTLKADCSVGGLSEDGCADDPGIPSHAQNTNILGGFEIGYDWQDRNFVYGVAADWSWTNLKGSTFGESGSISYESKVQWLASFRGRMGLAVDNTLVYVTGGVAIANTRDTVQGGGEEQQTLTDTPVGWVAGVGVEHKFNQHWSIKAEYRYWDLGSQTFTPQRDDESYNWKIYHTIQTGTVGFAYRF
jgi:outer membrane immunogenic protein